MISSSADVGKVAAVELVRAIVAAGSANCIVGNHEFNAIRSRRRCGIDRKSRFAPGLHSAVQGHCTVKPHLAKRGGG